MCESVDGGDFISTFSFAGSTTIIGCTLSSPLLSFSSSPWKESEKKEPKKKRKIYLYYLSFILSHLIHPIAYENQNSAAVRAQTAERSIKRMSRLTRCEQETIINFNAGEKNATVYTRDRAVMRQLDALVIGYPDVFQCVDESDIDKTYTMPKSAVAYRKPRRLTDKQREAARERLRKNRSG